METFTFNQIHRLVAYENAGSGADFTYAYDPFGRRVKKADSVTSDTTLFLWDGDRLLAEYDGASGAREVRYAYAGGFAPAQVAYPGGSGEEIFEVHSDHLDTPRVLTSDTGVPEWRASYEAFGTAHVSDDPDGVPGTPDPGRTFHIRFPGQYYDAETERWDPTLNSGAGGIVEGSGLHDNFHRYYDPSTGRYVSADPIGQFGGLNLFLYADNHPIGVIDPIGLEVQYNGFVITNPKVRAALDQMDQNLPGKNVVVTGGDRYIDDEGNVRSATTGDTVPDTKPTTPHAIENGGRAADVKVPCATDDEIKDAAKKSGFPDYNTKQDYDDGHTHVGLPNTPDNYVSPDVVAAFCKLNPDIPLCQRRQPKPCP